jgi:DNA polymerase III delta prime subunit
MIKQTLLDKWSENKMGHFFILRGPKEELTTWAQDLKEQFLAIDLGLTQDLVKERLERGFSDILEIKKEKEKYSWSKTQNDFTEFFKFLQYNPMEMKRKLVFLHDANHLTQDICNKILRTLEEVNNTTIFFLNPSETPMLSTIESRAITLRPIIKVGKQVVRLKERVDFATWAKNHELPAKVLGHLIDFMEQKEDPSLLLEALKGDKESQNNLFELLMAWESEHNSSFNYKKLFLDEVMRFKESQVYNNPYRERFFGLLTLCAQDNP